MLRHIGSILLYAFYGTAAAQPAISQYHAYENLAETFSVLPLNESVDGQLIACGLKFSALTYDRSTKKGAPVKIAGSYSIRFYPLAGMGYSLKLAIYDGLAWTDPSPPSHAFVRAQNGLPPLSISRLLAETPGYALFFGILDESSDKTLMDIVKNGRLVIGFNRAPKEQDVISTIDLHVENAQMLNGQVVRKKASWMVDEFSACAERLMSFVTKK